VLIDEKPDVLKLDRGPFLESSGGRFAYVISDGVARRQPVRIGATSVSAVEILDGLQQGDRVVISGSELFDNADAVQVNE